MTQDTQTPQQPQWRRMNFGADCDGCSNLAEWALNTGHAAQFLCDKCRITHLEWALWEAEQELDDKKAELNNAKAGELLRKQTAEIMKDKLREAEAASANVRAALLEQSSYGPYDGISCWCGSRFDRYQDPRNDDDHDEWCVTARAAIAGTSTAIEAKLREAEAKAALMTDVAEAILRMYPEDRGAGQAEILRRYDALQQPKAHTPN